MAEGNLFVYIATYDSEDLARQDYETLQALHAEDVVGSYDAAIVTHSEEGKIRVRKEEKPTQRGGWLGGAVGAVVGILFPPSILAGVAVGATTGALLGHFWGGMSRGDLKDLGELLDKGDSAILIVGESNLENLAKRAIDNAKEHLQKEITADSRALKNLIEQLQETGARPEAGTSPH